MIFRADRPQKSGYFWQVDLQYPVPAIVYYQEFTCKYWNTNSPPEGYSATDDGARKYIRWGDEIIPPLSVQTLDSH